MKRVKLTGTVPLPKRRAGVRPTRKEKDMSRQIERQAKHKEWFLSLDKVSHD